MTRHSKGLRRISIIGMLSAASLVCCWSIADETSDSQKVSPAITKMQGEMSKIKFAVIGEKGKESLAELKPEPILRYTDPQRAFPEATLWIWTVDGRPAGFCKIEQLGNATAPSWQYCVAGAHDERLVARWPDGIAWKSRKPGLAFQKMDYSESAQKSAQLRLAQLRNLSRRFRISTTDRESSKEEMRILAQPIFRYSNADQNLIDGAVFGVVSNGTNPDALLLIQVRQPQKDKPEIWEFGCLGMSGDIVAFELDGKPVFNHEGATNPGDHGHWLWLVLRD